MKIAYISAAAIPSRTANSIQIMKMCQAIVQNGHEIILFAPKRRKISDLLDTDIWHHYGIEKRFPIKWLPAPTKCGLYFYALAAVLYCRKVDVVFCRYLYSAVLAAKLGIPVIYETHELPQGRIAPFVFNFLLGSKNLRAMIVITNVLKRLFQTAYPNLADKKIVVLPDGVDLERFNGLERTSVARKRIGLKGMQEYIAGYAGHLYEGRGVEIIAALAKSLPKISFLVIGGEPDVVDMWTKESDVQGNRNIHFLGFIPNRILPQYLSCCDVLLMPYQQKVTISGGGGDTSQWMSPMKMFEYMACERPIISSDLPVLKEVLDDNNAILVPADNIKGWENALIQLVQSEKRRKSLASQARRDVEKYTWVRRVRTILNVGAG